MPKLQALGRKWFLASDDLLVSAFGGCAITCSWVLILCYMMYIRQWDSTCVGGNSLLSFYNVTLMFEIVDMAIWSGMGYISTRGTLINHWPRRKMEYLMRAKSTSQVCRLVYTIVWCVKLAYFDDLTDCDDTVVRCMRYAVNFNWLTTICSVLLFTDLYNPYYKPAEKTPRRRLKRRPSSIADEIVTATRQLRRQLSNSWTGMQKYLGVTQHPGIHAAKDVIADQFMGDLVESISPSDVFAGFFIVNAEQKLRWQHQLNQYFSREPDHQSHQCEDCLKPQPWMTIDNAHYYYKYTKASYGWTRYVFLHGFRAFWSLLRKDIGVLNQQRFLEDRFGLNTKTILVSTGLQLEDLIYVSYVDKGFEIPFYVALDHKTKTIVVAIRGTMSLNDYVTDFGGPKNESMDIDGLEDDCAHEGMLFSAQCIEQKLIGRFNRIHENATIEHVPERPILEMALDKLRTIPGINPSEYRLVIGGHSLGASVAAVLAILLRQEPNYQELMCFAYAPIGGLVSVPLARYCETSVCSVVVQDDFFLRMNTANVRDFRISLLQAIRNCDLPKHEIFTNVWKRIILKLFRISRPGKMATCTRKNDLAKPLYSSWHGDPEAERVVRSFQAEIDQAIRIIKRKKESAHPMSPPGCIIFIRELTEPCLTGRKRKEAGRVFQRLAHKAGITSPAPGPWSNKKVLTTGTQSS